MTTVDEQYKKLVIKLLQEGKQEGDRTGTGTIRMFAPGQLRFDLQEGFPLLGLKFTSLKLVFGELKWMMIDGSTSNRELQEKYGVTFWRHWQDEYGELPNIYGKQITRSEGLPRVIEVENVLGEPECNNVEYPIRPLESPSDVKDPYNLVGAERMNQYGDAFTILHYRGKQKKNHYYTVQFNKTGYISHFEKYNILSGKIRDRYKPSESGVGFLGDYVISSEEDKMLYTTWRSMIGRCYNPNVSKFDQYGGRGVYVDSRWHNFSNFIKDSKALVNWNKKKYNYKGYTLDKDYYGGNFYSKRTCVWLNKSDQSTYARTSQAIEVESPEGRIRFLTTPECAHYLGVHDRTVKRVLNQKGYTSPSLDGFNIRRVDPSEGFSFRYQLPVNQLNRVIAEIKNNPSSRRLVIDNWSAWDLDYQALPSCHAFSQFYVEDGKLSCQLYQRSVDVMMGLPYNIAFYSLLTHMIAHITGLEVGEFVHTGGDTHIYNNLLDMAKTVTEREPRQMPKLTIDRDTDTLYDFEFEDLLLEGYKPYPTIKGNVSI